MYEIGIEGLQALMKEIRESAEYAKAHYDELVARKSVYTLYGPSTSRIGPMCPTHLTTKSERKLLRKTRRKDYTIYELDEAYEPLRTIHVLDYDRVNCIFYHFKRNGIDYAYPFRGVGRELTMDECIAVKRTGDRAEYYASASRNRIMVFFLEYASSDMVTISDYMYFPCAQYTVHGYPVDWNAPIGALNSPVNRSCYQEPIRPVGFAHYFETEPKTE